jgi:hypothetical protein
MTTQTTTLADFLLARITEDTMLALKQPAPEMPPLAPIWRREDAWSLCIDPARVLAECEAKRRIVELHAGYRDELSGFWYCDACDRSHWPCETLMILAQPYSDHPDYLKEWKL